MDIRSWDLGVSTIDYHTAWAEQRRLHEGVRSGDHRETVLLLEHDPVFTEGKRTLPQERPALTRGAPVIAVDRGGKITFHGPGQLVGYPIVKLPSHVYVVDYVRRLEEALIRTCADFGLRTGRFPGRSGVWLPEDERGRERKLAALGIRVSKGVTMHGFALNCDIDLSWYELFVPCGISDAGVSSLSAELGRIVTVSEVAPIVTGHLLQLLAWGEYQRTPDFDPRPDPARNVPKIPLLKPAAVEIHQFSQP